MAASAPKKESKAGKSASKKGAESSEASTSQGSGSELSGPVAVVRTGGKQYVVSAGQKLLVEKLEGNPGDSISLSDVLLIAGDSTQVGTPTLSGVSVKATIVAQRKMKKVIHFKKQRRTGYLRTRGHRQQKTEIRIDSI